MFQIAIGVILVLIGISQISTGGNKVAEKNKWIKTKEEEDE